MEKPHKKIVLTLKKLAGTANRDQSTDSYTGSPHKFYAVSVPERRLIIKSILRELRDAKEEEIINLVDSLFHGKSHEEKTMASMILKSRPDIRSKITFIQLGSWIEELEGWAEIDSLCSNVFEADELLNALKPWKEFICNLAHDKNINKRRAALVLLVGPVAHSFDHRLHALSFKLVKLLAPEKEILITKAISWLLRSQVDTMKVEVAEFIKNQGSTLPKIAIRETKRKLETGKKNK